MSLIYASYPLLLPDDMQGLKNWMHYYQPLEDLCAMAGHVGRESSRTARRSNNTAGRGLPLPNYPPPPRVKLNTLYWPTGAARWSYGYFLADRITKDRIVSAAHSSGTSDALELEIGTPETYTIKADMYLLTPRPISPPEYPDGAWIIPLVDERFYWQDRYVDDLVISQNRSGPAITGTWSGVFSSIKSALGIDTLTIGAIPGGYLVPDVQELSRRQENAAVLLDAVAHSVGHRIVRDYDGVVQSMDWDTSATRLAYNLDPRNRSLAVQGTMPGATVCGGNIGPMPAPKSVRVAFPKYSHQVPHCDGDMFTITSDTDVDLSNGSTKVIHTTMFADFTLGNGPASPDNTGSLTGLASAVVSDFSSSVEQCYDYTFIGVYHWDPVGWDDHLAIEYGHQMEDGTRVCQTRVQSIPYNSRIEEQLSQDSLLLVIGHINLVKIDGEVGTDDLAADEDYKGTSIAWDGDSAENSDGNTESQNGAENATFMWTPVHFYDGEKAVTVWDCESNRHYLIAQHDDEIRLAQEAPELFVHGGKVATDTILNTNGDVWGVVGDTDIRALIDMWAEFYCEMDCKYNSGDCPSPRSGYFQLYKAGARIDETRARLFIENGINEGIGSSFTTIIACKKDETFEIRAWDETRFNDDAGASLQHVRFGARRLRVPSPA